MTLKIQRSLARLGVLFALVLLNVAAAANAQRATQKVNVLNPPPPMLVVMAIDRSPSFSGYRRTDTVFIGRVCRRVGITGGTVVLYRIGNISDQSGIRCTLEPVPVMDASLVLSQQLQLRRKINAVKGLNGKLIHDFQEAAQAQVISEPATPVRETDINGQLKKIDILLNEVEFSNYKRMVLVYSDGKQCIAGKTTGAHYDFSGDRKFSLYLCGWKTAFPTQTVAIRQFEDISGFAAYLENTDILRI